MDQITNPDLLPRPSFVKSVQLSRELKEILAKYEYTNYFIVFGKSDGEDFNSSHLVKSDDPCLVKATIQVIADIIENIGE